MVLEHLDVHRQEKNKKKESGHGHYKNCLFTKAKLKIDHRPRHKRQNYKTPRR